MTGWLEGILGGALLVAWCLLAAGAWDRDRGRRHLSNGPNRPRSKYE